MEMGITLSFGSLDIIKIFVLSRSQIGCKISFILVLNMYYFYVFFLSARIEQMSVGNGTGSTGAQKKNREKSPKGYLLSWPSFIGSTGIFNTIAVRLKIHYSVDTGLENRKTGLES